jgi:hypothetical protein
MAFLLVMLLWRVALRKAWPSMIAFCVTATILLTLSSGAHMAFPWVTNAVIAVILTATMVRAGLLPAILAGLVTYMSRSTPMTANLSLWYAESTAAVVIVLAGLAILALYLCLTGQRLRTPRPG